MSIKNKKGGRVKEKGRGATGVVLRRGREARGLPPTPAQLWGDSARSTRSPC